MAAIGIYILGGGCMGEAHALEVNQVFAAPASTETETYRTWQRSEHLKGYA